MSHKIFRWFVSLMLALALLTIISAPQPARAAGPWYVATTGDDNNDCLSPGNACATINGAIDKAADGDTINVAMGIYTGSGPYVVTIAKSLTLSGGWDLTFTSNNGVSTIDGQNARGGVSTAYYEYIFATMDHFVIQNGRTALGGGIFAGSDTLTLNNSSVINNVATDSGGGILLDGFLTLNNSTISGNKASSNGGGVWFSYGTLALNINNSTITDNSANQGGGLFIASPDSGMIGNSIIANNTAATGPDCLGTINTSDHNIIGNTSDCTVTAGTGDQFNVNPLISAYPLGVSAYHALLDGSPAIDAGDPTTCLSTDQRGVSRPQGVACDIGAYEYTTPGTATSFGVSAGSNQRVQPGLPFPTPFVIYVVDNLGSPVSGITVTFTAPASGPSGTFTDSSTNVTTAVSDSSGFATASPFTANNQTGNYSVNATASGPSGSTTFTLINAVWADTAWFVAATGNDSNSCNSPDSPCLTINSAIGKATNGEKIEVAAGIYASSSIAVVEINKNITLSGGWNETFSAQNGSSVIDGQNYGAGFSINYPYGSSPLVVTLDNFVIQNSGTGIGLSYNPIVTLNKITISGNGLGSDGGGIYMTSGTLTINNSTITNNKAGTSGGGIYKGSGSLTILNSTIANNSSSSGGGISNPPNGSGPIIMRNSILANNIANTDPDCSGTIDTSDHNIISNTSGCTVTAGTGDQFNVDPQLSTYLPAQGYYPLLPGSPAIDAGDNAICLNVDQRSVTRPQGAACDIGAYEHTAPGAAVSLSVVSGSNQLAGISSAFSNPLQAAALDSQGSPVSGVTVDFTAPGSGPSGTFADTGTNTTSAETNTSGVATASIFTANNEAGVYTVSASATGLGSVNFSLEQVVRPANDNFVNARPISSLPSSIDFDTNRATFESEEPAPSCAYPSPPYKTIWFAFTASQNGAISASIPSSNFSPFLAAYSGTDLNNLAELGCSIYSNQFTFQTVAGQTYYFQVGGFYGEGGTGTLLLEPPSPPQANFYFSPGDPSKFDTVQFYDGSYDPANIGIGTWNWDFGDGSNSIERYPSHKFATDGDYPVTLMVTTPDGRTATITQTIHIRTHDVAITKVTAPQSARSGQTKAITVSLRNTHYPETVTVDLYKSTPGGDVWISSLTLQVPVLSGNKTKQFMFNYTFTSQDAQIGKVTFRAVATINGANDAFPQDNTGISSPPTKVSR